MSSKLRTNHSVETIGRARFDRSTPTPYESTTINTPISLKLKRDSLVVSRFKKTTTESLHVSEIQNKHPRSFVENTGGTRSGKKLSLNHALKFRIKQKLKNLMCRAEAESTFFKRSLSKSPTLHIPNTPTSFVN